MTVDQLINFLKTPGIGSVVYHNDGEWGLSQADAYLVKVAMAVSCDPTEADDIVELGYMTKVNGHELKALEEEVEALKSLDVAADFRELQKSNSDLANHWYGQNRPLTLELYMKEKNRELKQKIEQLRLFNEAPWSVSIHAK